MEEKDRGRRQKKNIEEEDRRRRIYEQNIEEKADTTKIEGEGRIRRIRKM